MKKNNKNFNISIQNIGPAGIIVGFSILVLSKFIPTIYFGLFTGLGMLLAMIFVLSLMPVLILVIKPFCKVN